MVARATLVFSVLLSIVIESSAVAQAPTSAPLTRDVDIERFSPAPDADGLLSIQGTRTPGPWRWNAALVFDYASRPLATTVGGVRSYPIDQRLTGNAILQLGLWGRFALALDVPVALYQTGNGTAYDGVSALTGTALRDPRVSGRVRILGAESDAEGTRQDGEGLALMVATTIPVGQHNAFATDGSAIVEGHLLFDFRLFGFLLGGSLGYRYRSAERILALVRLRHQIEYGIGIESPAFVLENTSLLFEVQGATDAETPFALAASSPLEWQVGARFRGIRDWTLQLAGGGGWMNAIGSPGFRGVASVYWAPQRHDADHDNIDDDHDACVTLPEDFDGTNDEDGCPEPDNDGDLVPDLDDACPNDPAEFGRDIDDDGCNDPYGDADGDGMTDDVDACPADAEDADGFNDADGCPDLDNDGDGVPDASDACVNEAEPAYDEATRARLEDAANDGCPDSDHDNVADGNDSAPLVPEDIDGVRDDDGAPDFDNDGDGVVDALDRCPTESADVVQSADGCPSTSRSNRRVFVPTGLRRAAGEPTVLTTARFAMSGALSESENLQLRYVARTTVQLRADILPLYIGRTPSPAAVLVELPNTSEERVAAVRALLVLLGLPPSAVDVRVTATLRGIRATIGGPTP